MGGVDSLENLFVDKVMVGNSGLDSEWVLEVQRDVRVEAMVVSMEKFVTPVSAGKRMVKQSKRRIKVNNDKQEKTLASATPRRLYFKCCEKDYQCIL